MLKSENLTTSLNVCGILKKNQLKQYGRIQISWIYYPSEWEKKLVKRFGEERKAMPMMNSVLRNNNILSKTTV